MLIVAPCSDVVVIDSAAATVIDNAFVAVAPLASTIWTVKLNVPEADGVPVIAPVPELMLNPVGRAPAEIDQTNGVVPPLVAGVCEYAAPTVALASDVVVMDGNAATTIDSAFVSNAPTLSSMRTVKFAVPVAVGEPVIAPVPLFNARPEGNAPEEIDQVLGAVPPVDATDCE